MRESLWQHKRRRSEVSKYQLVYLTFNQLLLSVSNDEILSDRLSPVLECLLRRLSQCSCSRSLTLLQLLQLLLRLLHILQWVVDLVQEGPILPDIHTSQMHYFHPSMQSLEGQRKVSSMVHNCSRKGAELTMIVSLMLQLLQCCCRWWRRDQERSIWERGNDGVNWDKRETISLFFLCLFSLEKEELSECRSLFFLALPPIGSFPSPIRERERWVSWERHWMHCVSPPLILCLSR